MTSELMIGKNGAILALNNDGYELFSTFSKQSNKYNKSKVLQFWNSIKDNIENPKTLKSLMKAAKKDNEDEYRNIFDEFIIKDTELKSVYEQNKINFELNNLKLLDPIATIRDDKTLILRNKKDFTTVYENLLLNDGKKNISFVSEWLKDPKNRTYDKIDFLPMQQAPLNN